MKLVKHKWHNEIRAYADGWTILRKGGQSWYPDIDPRWASDQIFKVQLIDGNGPVYDDSQHEAVCDTV
jgi:hypothetical protein